MEPFEQAKKMIDKVSRLMGLSEEEKKLLLTHQKIEKHRLTVNGKTYEAWRIIHNNALGPGKGGIRYHPDVNESEVKALSFWMSIKNSLAGLPYGGAKGGIRFDPRKVDEKTLEEISRAYIRAFHKGLGSDKDIPAPDVYTNPKIMGWMLDEYEKITGKHDPAMITGKPLILGGIKLRESSTAKGGFIVLKELLKKKGEDPSKITVAVQGFGNAGSFVAKMCHEDGMKVVAVSDSKGGVYNQDGLDVNEVIEVKKKTGRVSEYHGGKPITNEDILTLDVDVLILAALEGVITEENAGNVKARYIVELANGPITPEGDDVLFKNGVIVVPDVLANSGGVVGSYLEWVYGKTGMYLTDGELESRLEERMKESFDRVYSLAEERKVDLRTAAYIISIRRILDAERARGNI